MKTTRKILSLFLAFVLVISTFGIVEVGASTTDTKYSKKYLQNGGFEENENNYTWSSKYTQPQTVVVPYWNTTAYNTTGANGKLEFFKDGAAHFNQSSSNKVVAEGSVAAELNADEVSTIYQRIETVSGSTYTWGLDHRGRDTTDTMVLFIGPEQYADDGNAIDPSKPSKTGQDQFVKMTDWLKTQYGISYPKKGCSQKYTIYSKPFAAKGAFQNESTNANENFSMTPTDECTEEWSLWVISSVNNNTSTDETVAVNGWSKYGTNCYNENEDSYNDVINGADSKLGYDCTYTVPKGQTKTLFAFTSYSGNRKSGSTYIYDATYGNLLDDINFKLYQPISSSITEGGTGGVVSGNTSITNDLQNGNLFYSTVSDGDLCTIHTKLTDGNSGHTFQGAYVTVHDDAGNPITKFVDIYSGDISNLTDEELLELSKSYFVPDDYYEHEGGEQWDFFYTVSVESPVHIHMMYTKAPYVLYDSNGGEPYQWTQDNSVGGNLIGFRDGFKGLAGVDSKDYYVDAVVNETTDETGATHLETIDEGFYISHTAVPNSNWTTNSSGIGAKFNGWTFNDADGKLVTVNGEHKIIYAPNETTQGAVTITDSNSTLSGLTLDASNGITMTAQWQFGYTAQAQTLLGHSLETQSYENSDVGGWVEETFINDRTNVTDYQDDYVAGRTERTDAYGAVGEKIIFRANPDAANNYIFDGWYKIKDGKYTLITTTPNLAITVEEGKSETYYARFKTKTVPVVFHYSESGASNGYDYYLKDADNKYGKYFQDVVYNEKAKQPPTNETTKVTMWFTSPTERDAEHIFDFSKQITEETHLYASPAFTYNYYNYFKFAEPWYINTYATLKFNGQYIDLQSDANISDYNIHILKGTLGEKTPSASSIIGNSEAIKVGKNTNSGKVLFNPLTNTGKTFYRAGTSFDKFYLFNMKTPVWVVFDFTYKGITYTSAVKDRSLYNNINDYMKSENSTYFSTFPPETQAELRDAQTKLLNSIKAMYDETVGLNIEEPTTYADATQVSDLTYDSANDGQYTFDSSTAIRNIEPWGFKYEFSVIGNDFSRFSDYGAVVLTDKDRAFDSSTVTVQDLLDNENSVMYSKSNGNIYDGANGSIEVYYVNNLTATDFDKNTYVAFFVKDSNGNYYYSDIVSNSYNSLASSDTSEYKGVSHSIKSYAEALVSYKSKIETAEYNKAQGYQ